MKIQYDYQIFSIQKYGGISRYFYELIKKFNRLKDIETNTSILLSNNYYISDNKFINCLNTLPNTQFRGKRFILDIFNKPYSILNIKKQSFDIFHPTYYNTYFLNHLGSKPFVLTVHDMTHEKFPNMFLTRDKTSMRKRLLVEKASKVIAVSENTKQDLIQIFGTDESKIEVIYHGNSILSNPESKVNINVRQKYLLFIGSRAGYKNFERFIRSVTSILKQDRELYIVCTGGGKFTAKELKLFANNNIKEQILQYSLDDNSLIYFYKNAVAFIFPSLYEGFGIPILESFACGCPLLCSNTSSFPEIAEEGALYFDPNSEYSIKNTVLKILNNQDLRGQLVLKGKERLKYFSWENTAIQTKKIYESIF